MHPLFTGRHIVGLSGHGVFVSCLAQALHSRNLTDHLVTRLLCPTLKKSSLDFIFGFYFQPCQRLHIFVFQCLTVDLVLDLVTRVFREQATRHVQRQRPQQIQVEMLLWAACQAAMVAEQVALGIASETEIAHP